MGIVKQLKNKSNKPGTIAGIDASSKAIAVAIFHRYTDRSILIDTFRFDLSKAKTVSEKLKIINKIIPLIFNQIKIDYIVVEQPIYIQNPQTSRILSQISGAVLSKCLENCSEVSEVTIREWKTHIGYKNVTKFEIKDWENELGLTEAKKKAIRERKERTIKIVHERIAGIDEVTDNDICDAIGIGLWALDNI